VAIAEQLRIALDPLSSVRALPHGAAPDPCLYLLDRKGFIVKKAFLILCILAIVPVAVFAELGVGGAAFYKSPVLLGQAVDASGVNVNQFAFGGDARFTLGWFQAEGLLLFSAGSVSSLNLFLDAGLALDLAMFRFSLGAGPNLTYNFTHSPATQAGLNFKAGADLKLGPISVGLSYIMALNISNGIDVTTGSGLLGASVLFWL
jgi:hypothetical protein